MARRSASSHPDLPVAVARRPLRLGVAHARPLPLVRQLPAETTRRVRGHPRRLPDETAGTENFCRNSAERFA